MISLHKNSKHLLNNPRWRYVWGVHKLARACIYLGSRKRVRPTHALPVVPPTHRCVAVNTVMTARELRRFVILHITVPHRNFTEDCV